MKNNLKFAVAMAALTVIIGAASAVSAQTAGGYKVIAKGDASAAAAAAYAVKAQSQRIGETVQLISVHKAERQVVAGTNFRLCIEVTPTGDETADSVYAQVVVYLDLKGNYKLTSWADVECAD